MTDTAHFLESGLREKVIEHLFVGDLLRCLWRQGSRDIEVLRAEVDRAGYDLVLECNGVLRHVQLKSSHRSAKTRDVKIHVNLAEKPSGCVIWIQGNGRCRSYFGQASNCDREPVVVSVLAPAGIDLPWHRELLITSPERGRIGRLLWISLRFHPRLLRAAAR